MTMAVATYRLRACPVCWASPEPTETTVGRSDRKPRRTRRGSDTRFGRGRSCAATRYRDATSTAHANGPPKRESGL